MKKWIPKFIRKNVDYKARQMVTAADYNAILNLLIAQGDYNSEWLQWLSGEGLAAFFKDLNGEDIKNMVVQAAAEQLAGLAAVSANKTSAYLNNPTFTFLDDSATDTAITVFKRILDENSIVGNVSCYAGLAEIGEPYTHLTDLQAAQVDGYAVVNHGYNTEPITDSEEDMDMSLLYSFEYMQANGLHTGNTIFVYCNEEEPAITIKEQVKHYHKCAIGKTIGVNDSDSYSADWLAVIPVNSGKDVITNAIEDAIKHNRWCVFTCDSSSSDFDEELLLFAIEEVKAHPEAIITTIPTAFEEVEHTINNKIKALNTKVYELEQAIIALQKMLEGYRKITHGYLGDAFPENANEGDIHIVYGYDSYNE